jgi:hypothetical protein
MATFDVSGPIEVPRESGNRMVAEKQTEFWRGNAAIAKAKGCYVFAIRAGGGYTPIYVGMTTNSFKQECFMPHQMRHYNYGLAAYKSGTPVMFFLIPHGRTERTMTKEVEKFLIQLASEVNPDLRNRQNKTLPKWRIKGVIRGEQGETTAPAREFRKMMWISQHRRRLPARKRK